MAGTHLPELDNDHPVLDYEPSIPPAAPPPARNSFFDIAGIVGFVAGLLALVAVMAWVIADGSGGSGETTTVVKTTAAQPAAAALPAAPTLAQAKGIAFEKFQKVDPTLAVPPGAVKKFTVDVDEHVVQ